MTPRTPEGAFRFELPGPRPIREVRPDNCHGKPCIQGARIQVAQVLDLIGAGKGQDTPDDDVLRLVVERSMVLLTNDKDFGDVLRYPPSSHTGVVVLRITTATETDVHKVLLRLLADHTAESLRATLAVVSRGKYRLKR